ncbi:MAG: hypothetical protein DI570_24370 [Phenylobacterium zucineum]|nr:MAG: hypothetical protein DI570_24370 [Phenylobacterium zucineum]
MARKPKPDLSSRTPLAEWIAAGCGLVLTVSAIGVTLWEGLTAGDDPPALSVVAEAPVRSAEGFVVPIVVRNRSAATAADVEVTGILASPSAPPQARQARFAYVPGRGEARGGLVFPTRPGASGVAVTIEGYADP